MHISWNSDWWAEVIAWKWHFIVMKPCDAIFFFFLSRNWFWNLYVLQALLTDCKAIGLYQQDEGCPAESKGDGRMPSVWVKTPTEPWHISRISNMEIGTGEFQKSPQVFQWSQASDIAIKKKILIYSCLFAEYLTKLLWFFLTEQYSAVRNLT